MINIYTLAVALTTLDIIFGSLYAFVNKDFKSSTFKSGAISHILAIFLIFGVEMYEPVLQEYNIAAQVVVGAYAVTEAISLLETYKSNGGVLPDSISKYINTKDKGDK